VEEKSSTPFSFSPTVARLIFMTRLILTGGIATGKSSFLGRVIESRPSFGVFDCDQAVHHLLTERPILARIHQLFGDRVFDDEVLNRSAMRQVVFADESYRRQLEDLLHPQVRIRCEECFVDYSSEHPEGLFIADVPLYFETHGAYPNDMVAVVATTRLTQQKRLMLRSQLLQSEAESIIQAQMPIEEKVQRADLLVWNESPIDRLDDQVALFCGMFPSPN
jgi:dephospho-CoA kinase